jgi:chromosome segregation ATPase
VLDQLETILRHVADELAGWRARAVKAEGELKESGGRGGASTAKPDAETRNRVADLEQENKTLRQRVEVARARVQDLLSRLTFLEEQAREAGGNGGARSAGGSAATGGSAPGASREGGA